MIRWREFFQRQLCGFPKVGHGFFDGLALANGAHFGALGDIRVAFLVDGGCLGALGVFSLLEACT